MNTGNTILIIADPCSITGGALRALQTLEWLLGVFKDVYVLVNLTSISRRPSECLASLIEKGAKVRLYKPKAGFAFLASVNASLARYLVNFHHNVRGDMIYSLHETAYEMALAVSLGEYLGVPKATLLQLPPLLEGSRFERVQRSMEFQKALLGLSMPRGREVLVKLRDIVIRRLLTRFDLVIAVSRAVVHDFPSILYLARRLKILDPGVGFTSDDIRLLEDIRRNATKGDYVIARGRLDKGVVEALIAYKLASSRLPYRLVIVDNEGLRLRLEKLAKLLSIGDRVVVMDSMTRTQFLKLLAGARALIYPSHMDAYPYTVAESLLLGTPVVAYRIPALEIYYGRSGIRGVYMVDEGDVGALSESLLEAVNTTIVEPPKVRMWSEIMNEELETLRSLL